MAGNKYLVNLIEVCEQLVYNKKVWTSYVATIIIFWISFIYHASHICLLYSSESYTAWYKHAGS